MRLSGKTAVVTGAAHGIGRATALRLAAEGARVAAIDIEADSIVDLAAKGIAIEIGDCTDPATAQRFIEHLGPVDILFNNVGQSARERASAFHVSEEATWRFVLEVSLLTTMRFSRLVAPGMRERRSGRIVNMSSDAAFAGDAGIADYAAAKMGVIGFTRSLARELAPFGVTVNAVCPGAIKTRAHDRLSPEIVERIREATPAGYVGTPEDVAAVVAFLAGDESRFVTGQSILIDGGRWMI
jgi:acetoacetyl-CoA reductase/3-oxoacyl-[acyl-carrier protein] reductase